LSVDISSALDGKVGGPFAFEDAINILGGSDVNLESGP
jgi:hypothetical protein